MPATGPDLAQPAFRRFVPPLALRARLRMLGEMTLARVLFGLVWGAALALGLASGCSKQAEAPKPPPLLAAMETDHGTIEIELLPAAAPKTVENFRLLAQRGYYDGLTFHRVVKGFMIQGGDPKGDGSGGESAWGGQFDDEIDRTSALYRDGYKRGSVAMANTGPNTNRSQFFIVQKDFPLHPGFTIFGRVVRGLEVVDEIVNVPATRGPDGNLSKPVNPPVIKKVTISGGAAGAK
jgi:cyclophilin family peptidyl-prolyl cis-trans isomerase